MSQLRSSINIHRENNLIGTFNLAFFEHVISATRIIRKELGYTSSTESMLNLATTSLEDILSQRENVQSVILGFGDMGLKAVETLQNLGQPNIIVVSRNPSKSAKRDPTITETCDIISYNELNKTPIDADIVISTMRCSTPAYTENNPLPISGQATILDFSWPPSIEVNGVSNEQVLLGMKHWIQVARNIDHSEYTTLMEKGDKAALARSGGSVKEAGLGGKEPLMDLLTDTAPHYVRCIKPNEHKAAFGFAHSQVLTQCRYLGLLEVVRIRQEGLPVRMPYAKFAARYENPLWTEWLLTAAGEFLQSLDETDDQSFVGELNLSWDFRAGWYFKATAAVAWDGTPAPGFESTDRRFVLSIGHSF